MRLRIGAALLAAVAIGAGLLTLIGLLVSPGSVPVIGLITSFFLQMVLMTVAISLLVGVLNLALVHIGRLARPGMRLPTRIYSLTLLLSFALVLGLALVDRRNPPTGTTPASAVLLDTVQVSLESALAALLLFALVYGATRLLQRRLSWSAMLFIAVLLFVLVAALPLSAVQTAVGGVRDWLYAVPVEAGARGILLGIALATLVAGVRILIGQDRSYRE